MAEFLGIVGFMLAAYSIVANDAIQTLGTFLSSNSKRPWWVLWAFASSVLMAVFIYGWIAYDGDITYGRLEKFPLPPGGITWIYIVPPIVIMLLTRFGVPVSTTFLVLAVFAPGNMLDMVSKSALGYGVAFALGVILYLAVSKLIIQRLIDSSEKPIPAYWTVIQWVSTAFLWSQWLIQDLANIFAYLPRQLPIGYLIFASLVMLSLHAIIFARGGGEIQKIVTTKTNTQDIRSATIIDFLFGLILVIFKEASNIPMSTTWVFLGLLAGRELGITLMLKQRPLKETGKIIAFDGGKALIGLAISAALAFLLPMLA